MSNEFGMWEVLRVRWEEDVGSAEWKAEARSQNSAVGAGPCACPHERSVVSLCLLRLLRSALLVFMSLKTIYRGVQKIRIGEKNREIMYVLTYASFRDRHELFLLTVTLE